MTYLEKYFDDTIYERIKEANFKNLATLIYRVKDGDADICSFCDDAGWCNEDDCIGAVYKWLMSKEEAEDV